MATNDYVSLTYSDGTGTKRFHAVEYGPGLNRTDTIEYTLGGKTDKQAGPVIKGWQFVFRVPIDTSEGTQYGVYADLENFFLKANANATPSDVIRLTDFWGGTYREVYFAESMLPKPISVILEGDGAAYMIPVTFVEKN